jgi:hypothetical protein
MKEGDVLVLGILLSIVCAAVVVNIVCAAVVFYMVIFG